jgi:hypothetical protein
MASEWTDNLPFANRLAVKTIAFDHPVQSGPPLAQKLHHSLVTTHDTARIDIPSEMRTAKPITTT